MHDEDRFGMCSPADNLRHALERRGVGIDDQYGEVTVLRCSRCGRCWLHYFIEYEYLTASGRWLEGEIAPDVAARVNARKAVALFDQMPWFYCSGSAFGDKLRRVTGPASTWLVPFPRK
jgi:hypothetical protein